MNLFLDDFRNPIECVSYTKDESYSLLKWSIVRSYDEFIWFIEDYYYQTKGLPKLISFDHDLADEHYDPAMYTDKYSELYKGFKEKTGYHCAQWLVDFCMDNKLKLPKFKVHSMNPAGGKNIASMLTQFARMQEEGSI